MFPCSVVAFLTYLEVHSSILVNKSKIDHFIIKNHIFPYFPVYMGRRLGASARSISMFLAQLGCPRRTFIQFLEGV